MRKFVRLMMPGCFSVLMAACAFLFLSSCNTEDTSDLEGTISITVVDANTGLSLDGVTVEFVGGSNRKTSSTGQVTFGGIKAGLYFVRISMAGYESLQDTVDVQTAGTENVVALNWAQTYALYKRGVSYKGRLLTRAKSTDAAVAAAGVSVQMRLIPGYSGDFVTPLRTVTTSATGSFSFDSLPEFATYQIAVPEFTTGGKTYSLAFTSVSAGVLSAGQQYVAAATTLAPSSAGNLGVFARSTSLVPGQPFIVEFSNSVDVSKLTFSSIQMAVVTSGASTTSIVANLVWSENNSTLSITPYQADWSPGVSYSIVLQGSIADTLGRSMGSSKTFTALIPNSIVLSQPQNFRLRATVNIRGSSIDTTVVDYATSTYRFSWSKVAGSEGYDLYYREGVDSAWKYAASTNTELATDTNITFGAPLPTGKFWKRYFLLMPYSSTVFVPNSLGAVMTVIDGVQPNLNLGTSGITAPGGANFNNTTATAKTVLLTLTANYLTSDPLDTNLHPSVTVVEGGASGGVGNAAYKPTGVFAWTGSGTGRIDMSISPNSDGRRDTVVVDFSNMTDLAGNPMDNYQGPAVLKFVTP